MRLLAALMVAILAGCAGTRTITILHTNDIHGRFLPDRASWREDSALVGGFAALSGALDSLRDVHEHVLYLDAGDVMTGNPICDQEVAGLKGGALLDLLAMCGLDAQCLGNHEFDLGTEHLRDFVKHPDYPLLCANLIDNSSGLPLCAPFQVMQIGRLRVGVVGLILNNLDEVTSQQAVEPFTISDISEAAQFAIDEIDERTDLIILLTHNGLDEDRELAKSVHGADVIVGGHSHTKLAEPIVENGVVIVQAGSYCKNLGELVIEVAGDSIQSFRGGLVELEAAKYTPDPQVKSLCDSFALIIEDIYGDVIAQAGEAITREYNSSSPLGNLLCDLLRERYNCEVALINSGGLRKDLAPGPITKLDCVELMPFMNSVCTFEVSGAELRRLAQSQAQSRVSGKAEVLQMSGLDISYQVGPSHEIISRILVNGEEVLDEREYSAVSIDYVLQSQWEKYLGFKPRKVSNTGLMFSDFIVLALAHVKQPVFAPHDLRLHEELK